MTKDQKTIYALIGAKGLPATITLVNDYETVSKEFNEKDYALKQMSPNENRLWETGLKAVASAPATKPYEGSGAFVDEHIASIRMYKSNSYIYLAPQDEVTIQVRSSEEVLYYAQMVEGTDMLSIKEPTGDEAFIKKEDKEVAKGLGTERTSEGSETGKNCPPSKDGSVTDLSQSGDDGNEDDLANPPTEGTDENQGSGEEVAE